MKDNNKVAQLQGSVEPELTSELAEGILHAMEIALYIIQDRKFQYVNPQFEQYTGYKSVELIGKDPLELVYPEDREKVRKEAIERLKGKKSSPYEYRTIRKDGETRDIIEKVVSFSYRGRPATIGTYMDITERKRVEADLRVQKELIDRILTSIPNAVLLLSKGLRAVLANRAFYDTFKVKKSGVEGRSLDDVVPVVALSRAASKVLATSKPRHRLEFRHEVSARDKIMVADIIPMGREEVLVIISDETDERRRQERLYLTDRLASVGEMASGIAHELNNPLTSVIGLSQLLVEEDLPNDTKEDIEAIYSEAQRAAEVVKNLLTFARKHAPVSQLTQINSVIEDVLKLRAYEHRVNNLQIDTRFDPELPEIMADYFQMQQVFLNIILNAEGAMIEAHNRGTLTITTEKVDGNIKVSFTDDGPGIPRENLGQLFDPFFTTKEVGKGTGLGLSICYGIVTGHGGKIYAQSEVGKGATFIVELPANAH